LSINQKLITGYKLPTYQYSQKTQHNICSSVTTHWLGGPH